MKQALLQVLTATACLWLAACGSSVKHPLSGSGFMVEEHTYSAGPLRWLTGLGQGSGSKSGEYGYQKLYHNNEYLDLYALCGCQTDVNQGDLKRSVRVAWHDLMRVQGKPVFIVGLPFCNADLPFEERKCKSNGSDFLIREKNNRPEIIPLGCGYFTPLRGKFALALSNVNSLVLMDMETMETDTLFRDYFLPDDLATTTLSPDGQTFAYFNRNYTDSLGYGWQVLQIQRNTHRTRRLQVSHLDDSTSQFLRGGVDAELQKLFRWQKDTSGMTVLMPLSDTLRVKPVSEQSQ